MNKLKKFFWITGVVFLAACTGQLTDDQRKRLKDGMKRNEIKKISDAQVTDAAFAYGRAMVKKVGVSNFNLRKIDSLSNSYKVKIVLLSEHDSKLSDIENQIVEAYATGADSRQLTDNVQEIGKDSILYTKPFLKELPDGSNQFNYAIGIRVSRKQIVLSM